MMRDSEMSATPEVDRMVDDFFAQALVHDANETVIAARITVGEFNWVSYGMKPPTVPPDLCGLIARIGQHADWSSVSNRIRLQWRERLGPIAQKNTIESYEKRVACLAPIDRLKLDACNPTSHPTEATLVAKWYLDGTYDTPRDHEYAGHLLSHAADCGNAEAAYLLATATITGETADGPRKAVAGFIVEDARRRDEYRTQARAARFFKVFQDKNEARRYEDFTDRPVDYLREQLDSDLQNLTQDDEADPSAGQAGDPDAQWRLAMSLLHQADCIERHSELCAKDEMTRRRRDALKAEARSWLLQASPALSWPKHQLAMRFAEPGEERFTLLHMAAVPTGEVSPCPLALVPLATDFYMNPASTYHDISKGLSCLREYLGQYESVSRELERIARDAHIGIDEASGFGIREEDAQAALCLADYVRVHPQDARGPEAYIWYSAVAANIRNAAYAALMAGLLELRGQGCEKNLIRAKKLLDLARKSSPGNPRDTRAVKYADALYRLGFELPGHGRLAVDLLFELAKEFKFKGDPDCAIIPADIADLVARNPNLEHYCQKRDDSRNRRKTISRASGPYGEFALFPDIAEGLIWALQPQETIPGEALGKLWGDTSSMIEDYVWVRLELSSRLVPSTGLNDAEQRISRVIELADGCLRDDGSAYLDMNGFTAVQDLRAEALHTALEIGTRLAKEHARLAEEHAREDERRQMISFLSHTLVNVTVGTSRMLREIMAELAAVRDPARVAALAVRLAPTATRASVVESLVKVFKLYTSDPDALRKDWESEQGGDHSVAQTVVLALQMTLLRFCRMPEFKSARRRLLPDVQYDALTAELISEIMPLDGSSAAQLEQLAAWVERRMPFLRLSLAGAEDLRVMEDGARHIVIFALVGEFLTNALKFTGAGGAISLSVTRTDIGLELACRNPVDTEMPRPLLSGKTGLDFVRKVCQLVAARFDEPGVDGGAFSVHAVLPIQ